MLTILNGTTYVSIQNYIEWEQVLLSREIIFLHKKEKTLSSYKNKYHGIGN